MLHPSRNTRKIEHSLKRKCLGTLAEDQSTPQLLTNSKTGAGPNTLLSNLLGAFSCLFKLKQGLGSTLFEVELPLFLLFFQGPWDKPTVEFFTLGTELNLHAENISEAKTWKHSGEGRVSISTLGFKEYGKAATPFVCYVLQGQGSVPPLVSSSASSFPTST